MKILYKGYCLLLDKQIDKYIRLRIRLYKSDKITTTWSGKNAKEWLIQQRKKYKIFTPLLQQLKSNGCAICGYNECSGALDFHHANPRDKKFNINTGAFSRSNKTITEEINKCILLCRNCHAEIHTKGRLNADSK